MSTFTRKKLFVWAIHVDDRILTEDGEYSQNAHQDGDGEEDQHQRVKLFWVLVLGHRGLLQVNFVTQIVRKIHQLKLTMTIIMTLTMTLWTWIKIDHENNHDNDSENI